MASSSADVSPTSAFRFFDLPTGERALIPSDLELMLPEHSSLGLDQLHFLVTIPWNERYLSRIDADYRDFFRFVLPYLHTRTTDVHIATCFPFVDALIQAAGVLVDRQVVSLAFILHDVGWSQLSEAEIAASLSTTGVVLTQVAQGPKEKHALVGRDLAVQLLEKYPFVPPLTAAQQGWIAQAVLYHDKPWELAKQGALPLEIKLVCDVDHLWSLTHENFWQDTVRKGAAPPAYLDQLARE
ncbi:MAG TPA: HD domain-containing protein, partial [Ktedonobacterales bacterium]|nr:HD domain-containing protein [Ktedonobacterales bacterium]